MTDESQSSGDSSIRAVRAQIFNADGTPAGAEFMVNLNDGGAQTNAAVAALAGGGLDPQGVAGLTQMAHRIAWRDR